MIQHGTIGLNMGNVKIQLPDGFTAKTAFAMRSTSSAIGQEEYLQLSADGDSVIVKLPVSTILSVRFTR